MKEQRLLQSGADGHSIVLKESRLIFADAVPPVKTEAERRAQSEKEIGDFSIAVKNALEGKDAEKIQLQKSIETKVLKDGKATEDEMRRFIAEVQGTIASFPDADGSLPTINDLQDPTNTLMRIALTAKILTQEQFNAAQENGLSEAAKAEEERKAAEVDARREDLADDVPPEQKAQAAFEDWIKDPKTPEEIAKNQNITDSVVAHMIDLQTQIDRVAKEYSDAQIMSRPKRNSSGWNSREFYKTRVKELKEELRILRPEFRAYERIFQSKNPNPNNPKYGKSLHTYRMEKDDRYRDDFTVKDNALVARVKQEERQEDAEKAEKAEKLAGDKLFKRYQANRGRVNMELERNARVASAMAANDADMAQGGVSSRFTSPEQARKMASLERRGGIVKRGGRLTVGPMAPSTREEEMYASTQTEEEFFKQRARDRQAQQKEVWDKYVGKGEKTDSSGIENGRKQTKADMDQEDLKRFYLQEKGNLQDRYKDVWKNPTFQKAYRDAESNARKSFAMRSTDTRNFREEMLSQIKVLDRVADEVRRTVNMTNNQAEMTEKKTYASEEVSAPNGVSFRPTDKVYISIDKRCPGAEGEPRSIVFSPYHSSGNLNLEGRDALNRFGIVLSLNNNKTEDMSGGRPRVRSVNVSLKNEALRVEVGGKLINIGRSDPEGKNLRSAPRSMSTVKFDKDIDVGSIAIGTGKNKFVKFNDDNVAAMKVDGFFVSKDGQFKITRQNGSQFMIESCNDSEYTVHLKSPTGGELSKQTIRPVNVPPPRAPRSEERRDDRAEPSKTEETPAQKLESAKKLVFSATALELQTATDLAEKTNPNPDSREGKDAKALILAEIDHLKKFPELFPENSAEGTKYGTRLKELATSFEKYRSAIDEADEELDLLVQKLDAAREKNYLDMATDLAKETAESIRKVTDESGNPEEVLEAIQNEKTFIEDQYEKTFDRSNTRHLESHKKRLDDLAKLSEEWEKKKEEVGK